jgi:VIT1/CCC1 family predicted Fe2+/Mn2+ transporter
VGIPEELTSNEEILARALGLTGIEDSDTLRDFIEMRWSMLNPAERIAVQMRIGQLMSEEAARAPGARYSPPSWSLLVVVCICLTGAAILIVLALRVSGLWAALPLVGALILFPLAWSALARVVYRIAKGRDWH